MIYISHRGLINGPDLNVENNPDQIEYLLSKHINVEIDIHFYKGNFYLDHDEPKYEIKKVLSSKYYGVMLKHMKHLMNYKNKFKLFLQHQKMIIQ